MAFVVLFGSQARGNTHQWSDIDLVVVSPHFDGPRQRKDTNLLWRKAARVDSRIEPIACGLQQWSDDTTSAIIEMARREGKTLRELVREVKIFGRGDIALEVSLNFGKSRQPIALRPGQL